MDDDFVPLELDQAEIETVPFPDEDEPPSYAAKGLDSFIVSPKVAKGMLLHDDISPDDFQALNQKLDVQGHVLLVAGLPYTDDVANSKVLVKPLNGAFQEIPLKALYDAVPRMAFRHVKVADHLANDLDRAQIIQAVNQTKGIDLATRVSCLPHIRHVLLTH